MQSDLTDDRAQIQKIIDDMFVAISWREGNMPDLVAFGGAVRDEAVLIPSARPIATTSIGPFVERMSQLHSSGNVVSFQESSGKTLITSFGNIAVAIGAFDTQIDGVSGRGVNAFLFVRDADEWQIAGMAWDNEADAKMIPEELR